MPLVLFTEGYDHLAAVVGDTFSAFVMEAGLSSSLCLNVAHRRPLKTTTEVYGREDLVRWALP